ncbi:MAG TPA: GNAT family N-acetyltransferase [Candidatus Polarisedimenticolaceae bacterium]|nr:GNAT family N-acetyltransferase [Candidatus Polarisedimenticolaceae bacterium]
MIAAGVEAFARFGDYEPILRAFLGKDDVSSWIAEEDGHPAGFALVERPLVLPGFADLVAIAVTPEHRRRGLAGGLLRAVVQDAERRGEPLLALTVAEDNAAAIALFTRHGFRMIPGSAGHYAGGQRSRRMVRPGAAPPHEMPENR